MESFRNNTFIHIARNATECAVLPIAFAAHAQEDDVNTRDAADRGRELFSRSREFDHESVCRTSR